jgi:uncharacterized protein (UPF0548 family)
MTPLDPERVAGLRQQSLSYEGVGGTRRHPPAGYHAFARSTALPAATDFESATRRLFTWHVQEHAGLRVNASDAFIVPDTVAVLRLLGLPAPVRVVYVIDEPDTRGFAYGTLPGHPESGEESFTLRRHNDGMISFMITAFSRPARLFAKLAGPVGRRLQGAVTSRYLRAFR